MYMHIDMYIQHHIHVHAYTCRQAPVPEVLCRQTNTSRPTGRQTNRQADRQGARQTRCTRQAGQARQTDRDGQRESYRDMHSRATPRIDLDCHGAKFVQTEPMKFPVKMFTDPDIHIL